MPQRRTFARAFSCVVALGGIAAAIYGAVEHARAWPLLRDAASLESGARYRRLPSDVALADPQLPKPGALCNPQIQRSLVTARLSVVDAVVETGDFSRFDEAAGEARESVDDLLRCLPIDGNAWLRLAMIEVQRSGPTPEVVDALKTSYRTATADLWVMRARIPFALRLVSAGVDGIKPQLRAELGVFMADAFVRDIAIVYAMTPVQGRALLDEHLRQFEPRRYASAYRMLVAADIAPDPERLPPPPPPPPRYPRP